MGKNRGKNRGNNGRKGSSQPSSGTGRGSDDEGDKDKLSYNPYKGHELQEEGQKVYDAQMARTSKFDKAKAAEARKRKQDQEEAEAAVARESQYFDGPPPNTASTYPQTANPQHIRSIDQHRIANAKFGTIVPSPVERKVGSPTFQTVVVEGIPPYYTIEDVRAKFPPGRYPQIIDAKIIKGAKHHDLPEGEQMTKGVLFVFSDRAQDSKIVEWVGAGHNKYLGCGYRFKARKHLKTQQSKAVNVDAPNLNARRPWGARLPLPADDGHLQPPVPGREHIVVDLNRPIDILIIREIHAMHQYMINHEGHVDALAEAQELFAEDEAHAWLFDDSMIENAYLHWLIGHGYGGGEIERKERLEYAKDAGIGPEKGVFTYHRLHADVPHDIIPPFKQIFYQYLTPDVKTGKVEPFKDPSHQTAKFWADELDESNPNGIGMHINAVQMDEFSTAMTRLPRSTTKPFGSMAISLLTRLALKLAHRDPWEMVYLYTLNIAVPLNLTHDQVDPAHFTNTADHEAVPFMQLTREKQSANLKAGETLEDCHLVGLQAISDLLTTNAKRGGITRFPTLFLEYFRLSETFFTLGTYGKKQHLQSYAFPRYVGKVKSVIKLWAGYGTAKVNIFPRKETDEMMSEFFRGLNHEQKVSEMEFEHI